jgi:AraC family transcriptional regulator of arabinose operon
MLKLNEIRHAWPENTGFVMDRPSGHGDWTFIDFEEPVVMSVNGKEQTLDPHSCILYSPSCPQYYRGIMPTVHDWFHFDPDDIDIFSSLGIPVDTPFTARSWDVINRTVKDMEHEFLSRPPHCEQMIRSYSAELFISLSRQINGTASPSVNPDTEPRLSKLRAQIFSSLSHPWTVEEMATAVGLSPSRFHAVYRAAYGISPASDLINARINAAKDLLTSSSKSITEISESLGYGNITHFMRQFRSFTGTSPKKYRDGSRSGII